MTTTTAPATSDLTLANRKLPEGTPVFLTTNNGGAGDYIVAATWEGPTFHIWVRAAGAERPFCIGGERLGDVFEIDPTSERGVALLRAEAGRMVNHWTQLLEEAEECNVPALMERLAEACDTFASFTLAVAA